MYQIATILMVRWKKRSREQKILKISSPTGRSNFLLALVEKDTIND